MRTAACYIRVSTDDQTEYSPDSQLKVVQDYAQKHDILLLEDCIFAEDGGKSGKNMARRTEFLRLIAMTRQQPKPFDIILVWKFSRFARNQEEAIVLKSRLKKAGIEVISVSEPLPEGPFGSLVERIIEWNDEYYLVNLAQEVKRCMNEKAGRGEPVCPPPTGYDMVGGKFVPNDDAHYIRDIFAAYLAGEGCRAIAQRLGKLGMKTKRGNPPDNRFIEYILRNPVYCGKIRWSRDGRTASQRRFDDPNLITVPGEHEPLVSQQTFDAVQKRMDETKKRYVKYQRREQSVQHMLKGLVRCSACGSTLTYLSTATPSLQCHNYAKGKCHVSHCISLSKAENLVIDYLRMAVDTGDFTIHPTQPPAESASNVIDLERILKNSQARLERIKKAYQEGVDTLEEYKQNKAEVMRAIEKAKAQSKKVKKVQVPDKNLFRNKILNVLDVLTSETQSPEAKNLALRSIVSQIEYQKAKNKLVLYFYE